MLLISEIDDDSLLDVARFIAQDEQKNITLSSLFYSDGKCSLPSEAKYKIFLFRTTKDELKGVVSFSEHGQILHCLKFTSETEKAEFCKLLADEIPHKQVFCIIGEKEGCELVASAVKRRRQETRSYMLMHYEGNTEKLHLPENLELVKCEAMHLDDLVPLQKGYEMDEVLLDAADFEEAVCRLTLRKTLREQIVYALFTEPGKKAVAKAGTNARGLNWYQLGGIYTVPQYRNHGFAAFLAQTLALKNAEMGKKTALFVKCANIPAKKAYTKAGFVTDTSFEIIYY
ncbi:MAG: hypothetical protein K5751_03680 [Treponemataceae bacterium]|nr:hypothetical protein [Treponemataceae bacterium]